MSKAAELLIYQVLYYRAIEKKRPWASFEKNEMARVKECGRLFGHALCSVSFFIQFFCSLNSQCHLYYMNDKASGLMSAFVSSQRGGGSHVVAEPGRGSPCQKKEQLMF